MLSFTQACARHQRRKDERDTISAFTELTVYYFRFLDFEGQVQSAVKWVRREQIVLYFGLGRGFGFSVSLKGK